MEWPGSDEDEEAEYKANESDGEIEVDNIYHEAVSMMNQQPIAQAMDGFETVLQLEENRNENRHSFNATKFVIMLAP